MTYTDALSAEIRAELARRRMTGRELWRQVAALAEEAGNKPPSHPTIARMLRAEYAWDVNTLDSVAKALDVSLSDLLSRAETVFRCTLPLSPLGASSLFSGMITTAA